MFFSGIKMSVIKFCPCQSLVLDCTCLRADIYLASLQSPIHIFIVLICLIFIYLYIILSILHVTDNIQNLKCTKICNQQKSSKGCNKQFSEKADLISKVEIRMSNKHIKTFSTSHLIIRKILFQNIFRFYLSHFKIAC